MSLAIDNIKIKYSREGYLPNYPPHLISDEEMCEAFLPSDDSSTNPSYFYDNYYLGNEIDANLSDEQVGKLVAAYEGLIAVIHYHISKFLNTDEENKMDLPDWVYAYMMGHVVGNNSDQRDKHWLLVALGVDNIEDIMTVDAQLSCLDVSTRYVETLSGEAKNQIEYTYYVPDGLTSIPFEVIHSIVDNQWDKKETPGDKLAVTIPLSVIEAICNDTWDGNETPGEIPEKTYPISIEFIREIMNGKEYVGPEDSHYKIAKAYMRPPTMFGEPHVIKQLRLYEAAGIIYPYKDSETSKLI